MDERTRASRKLSTVEQIEHIVVCTKKETIEQEIKENKDPNHEDYWPVSNFPTRQKFIPGESRLFLSDGEDLHASFLIEGVGEREWQGKTKKVVLLKKDSVQKAEGKVIACAIKGGFRYCPECTVPKKKEDLSNE